LLISIFYSSIVIPQIYLIFLSSMKTVFCTFFLCFCIICASTYCEVQPKKTSSSAKRKYKKRIYFVNRKLPTIKKKKGLVRTTPAKKNQKKQSPKKTEDSAKEIVSKKTKGNKESTPSKKGKKKDKEAGKKPASTK
jgi:hypothetical protein